MVKPLQKVVCPEVNCGKEFSSIYNLKLHKNYHSDNFKFWCSVCGKGFLNKNHYHTHCNTHSDTTEHKCSNCEKFFNSESSLTQHTKVCAIMNKFFQCMKCRKYFKSKETLGKHLKGIHKVNTENCRT